jgi:hypothetical protein
VLLQRGRCLCTPLGVWLLEDFNYHGLIMTSLLDIWPGFWSIHLQVDPEILPHYVTEPGYTKWNMALFAPALLWCN